MIFDGSSGLGKLTAQQDINYAATGVTIGTSVGLAIAGATAAIPFVGPIVAGAALLANVLGVGQGCGQTCIQATNCANATADAMQKNMAAYFAIPPDQRTLDMQQQALANFVAIFNDLKQCCSNQGHAGDRCVSERDRGGKYDDWKYNYDPIANDPVIAAKKSAITAGSNTGSVIASTLQSVASALTGGGSNSTSSGGNSGRGGLGLVEWGLLIAGGLLVIGGLGK